MLPHIAVSLSTRETFHVLHELTILVHFKSNLAYCVFLYV